MSKFDWGDILFFLEMVRTSQLSAAGRKLKVSHTTVARRIQRLEKDLGTKLFHNKGDGYVLSEEGERILALSQSMELLADKISEATASFSERIDGSVRVGSPDGFGNAFLSNILPRLQETHPNLNIELVPVPISQKLWRRDVDIAISLDRPDTGRILMRKLTDYDLRIYGAPELLAAKGMPLSKQDLRRFSFVGYIDDLIYTDMLDFNRLIDPQLRVSYKGATVKAQIDAVKAGAGLGVLPCYMARGTELVAVLDQDIQFVRSYWLLLPEELGNVERVRVVADYIAKATRQQAAQFSYMEKEPMPLYTSV